jgi:hypothetical protein
MLLICIIVHFGKVGKPVDGKENCIQSSLMDLQRKWRPDIVNEGT